MQIKTIHVRIDAVDAPVSAGRRNAREEAASVDAAFATIFANVQHDLHRPKFAEDEASVEPVHTGNDAPATPETAAKATPVEPEATTPSKTPHTTSTSETVQTESDDTGAAEPSVKVESTRQLSDVAYAVSTGEEQASIAASRGNTAKTAAQSAASDLVEPTIQPAGETVATVQPVIDEAKQGTTAAQHALGTLAGQVASADEPTAISVLTAGRLLERAASLALVAPATATNKPPATAKLAAAPEADLVVPQAAVDEGATAREMPARPSVNIEALKATETIVVPRVDASSKLVPAPVHTAAAGTPATNQDAQLPPPVSTPAADGPQQQTAEPSDLADGAVVADGSESTEMPGSLTRPAAPTLRYVAETVTPANGSTPMQTTEIRIETGANGQREIVVIERTPLQALPEQAVRGARFLVGNGESVMRVRLMPESLGEVRLEVVTSKTEVSVKLASANADVREVLQTHAHGLRDAIAVDGSQAVRVTVTQDLGAAAWLSGNGNRGAQADGGQTHGGGANHPAAHRHNRQDTAPPARRDSHHNGRLNVYA